MLDYGTVRSNVRPEPMVIDDHSVWIHTDIQEVTETNGDETFTGFEYQMIQYTKDEFIHMIAAANDDLNAQVTDLELALVELYEGMV